MILIGQYDSPFVRRVAFALRHYGMDFEHRAHSVFRDASLIAAHNPLRRVPTLITNGGTVFTETSVCLDVLDGRVAIERGSDCADLLLPRAGASREVGLRVCGFINGVLDKAVSLVYEREVRSARDAAWVKRCELQVHETLQMLEAERAAQSSSYWLGSAVSHADIAASCAITFIHDALPGAIVANTLPALHALNQRCESLPQFEGIFLPFNVPKSDVTGDA